MISSIGSTVPVSSRAAATRSSVSHAARRHGRLSQGAAATTTAVADAISAGPGNAAPASQEPRARLSVSASGCWPPNREKIAVAMAAATTAPTARPASSRNRRLRSAAATTTAAAARHETCTRPVVTRRVGPRLSTTGAAGPSSQRNAAAEAASEQPSRTIPPISRITSPG